MKIIAFYLPQFHEIDENNKIWGKGFTEWTNVKKAKPLFEGHCQPVIPLNKNYYNLLNNDVLKWQVDLAKHYGIYGFCFYHYWYNSHLLLEKPVDIFLEDKSLNLPFCICWANHDWTQAWVSKEDNVLYKQDYSDKEDWEKHFQYFLKFFKDKRYIKKSNKPLLVIYQIARNDDYAKMLDYWIVRAIENGFNGIDYALQSSDSYAFLNKDNDKFTYLIEYQPQYARKLGLNNIKTKLINLLRKLNDKTFKIKYEIISKIFRKHKVTIIDYDEIWQKVLNTSPYFERSIPGAFVQYDTTPRRQERGIVAQGMTPDKFKKYLSMQIVRAKKIYKKDIIFLFAWNEWAEGGYVEPDERWGYGSLEAIKQALLENNEFPDWSFYN